MIITCADIDGFKNLHNVCISPDPQYNIIIGRNAQGKTNLLEAMWILTGCKSFRGSRDKDFIAHDGKAMHSQISFRDFRRVQKISFDLSKTQAGRSICVNDVKVKGTSSLFDIFKCIVFTPDDSEIIKGSPEKRRNFIDMAASQLNPISVVHLTRSNALLNQRNAVLKNVITGLSKRSELSVWDKQVAKEASFVSFMRYDYVSKLSCVCNQLYRNITGGCEELSVGYRSNVFSQQDFSNLHCGPEAYDLYFSKLQENTDYDLKFGYTHTGISRDEITVRINGYNAKDFASQGQIKSAALVMKLAQAQLYCAQSRETPVVFLDDVMGELDESRQKLVFDIVKNMQVFITCCNESALLPEINGKIFRVADGLVSEEV